MDNTQLCCDEKFSAALWVGGRQQTILEGRRKHQTRNRRKDPGLGLSRQFNHFTKSKKQAQYSEHRDGLENIDDLYRDNDQLDCRDNILCESVLWARIPEVGPT